MHIHILYISLFTSFHSLMLKNKVVTCELFIPSNSAGYGTNAPTCPIFPALPLHIQMLPFTLICSFILSCLPLEQCSLNPLFSLCVFGEILFPVCEDGNTCQSLRQTGITALQEHTTSPHPAIFRVLIERTLSFLIFLPC